MGHRSTRLRGRCALGATVALSLAGTGQATELRGARLESTRTDAASQCPDEEALARAVQSHLTEHPPVDRQPVVLSVHLDRDDGGFVAYIQVSGREQGYRSLRSEERTCDALAEALVLTLAMILDDRAREVPQASPPQPQPPPPAALPVDARRSSGWLSFGGLAVTTGLPTGLSWAAIAEVGIGKPPWGVTLGGFWSPTRSRSYGAGTASVRLMGALAAVCYEARTGESLPVAGLCFDAAAGSLQGSGTGYDVDREERRFWAALGGGPEIRGEITRSLGWRLRGTLAAPLWHDSFSVDGMPGAAYESPPVVGWVSAHLSATIW